MRQGVFLNYCVHVRILGMFGIDRGSYHGSPRAMKVLARAARKLHDSRRLCEQGVVACASYMRARKDARATLADNNSARLRIGAMGELYSEPLSL